MENIVEISLENIEEIHFQNFANFFVENFAETETERSFQIAEQPTLLEELKSRFLLSEEEEVGFREEEEVVLYSPLQWTSYLKE